MFGRSRRSRNLIAIAGLIVAPIGVTAWLAVLAVRAVGELLAITINASLAPLATLLEGLVSVLSLMINQEIVVVAIIWAARGPWWTLAWIGWRISTCQDP